MVNSLRRSTSGEMAEWFKAHAWKACVLERVPRVRIPVSPPAMHAADVCCSFALAGGPSFESGSWQIVCFVLLHLSSRFQAEITDIKRLVRLQVFDAATVVVPIPFQALDSNLPLSSRVIPALRVCAAPEPALFLPAAAAMIYLPYRGAIRLLRSLLQTLTTDMAMSGVSGRFAGLAGE